MPPIPRNHPRYHSLKTREQIAEGVKAGIVHTTGLIAHGRGEAFDYLLGETTIPTAVVATKTAAAILLIAKNPVISINGNVAVLSAEDCVSLAKIIPAKLEVNLFHRTPERMKKIINLLEEAGASDVYGTKADGRIPGLEHSRGICDKDGIFSADVILVPLEDGDRCKALKKMGKTVITIDLNPLSRTSITSDITIVDNLIRTIPNLCKWVREMKAHDVSTLMESIKEWNNSENLQQVKEHMAKRLNSFA